MKRDAAMATDRASIKARISATANPKPRLVDSIPEWGVFYLRPGIVDDIDDVPEGADQRTKIIIGIAKSVCDAEGNLIFDRNDPEDMATLRGLPTSLIGRLGDVVGESAVNSPEKAIDLGNVLPPATDSSST